MSSPPPPPLSSLVMQRGPSSSVVSEADAVHFQSDASHFESDALYFSVLSPAGQLLAPQHPAQERVANAMAAWSDAQGETLQFRTADTAERDTMQQTLNTLQQNAAAKKDEAHAASDLASVTEAAAVEQRKTAILLQEEADTLASNGEESLVALEIRHDVFTSRMKRLKDNEHEKERIAKKAKGSLAKLKAHDKEWKAKHAEATAQLENTSKICWA